MGVSVALVGVYMVCQSSQPAHLFEAAFFTFRTFFLTDADVLRARGWFWAID